jgi:MoaA/NifB/PqqE/SkfB family radical SAM enzyme
MEGVGEHVHWYTIGSCNSRCTYCFGPHEAPDSSYLMEDIARVLAGKAKKVTITGGEPLLAGNLEKSLGILKQGGVYVSLHTNGILLDGNRIEGLSGLVDDIAIPIDSTNRRTQAKLRTPNFMPVYDRLDRLAESVQKKGIKLGYHTVFTKLNREDIPDTYKFVKGTGFNYWRVYKLNEELACSRFIGMHKGQEVSEQQIKEWESISSLVDAGTPKKGFTDSLFADFLLTERKMKKHRDKRVQFVLPTDSTYFFVDNIGNVTYYDWFSYAHRMPLGNVMSKGFRNLVGKLKEMHDDTSYDGSCEDDFVNSTIGDVPLWGRYYDGNYDFEETRKILPKYHERFFDLVILHGKRVRGIDLSRRKL